MGMLFRFSLYGFLKNQQYYDPFIILAFREKGLSFFVIGLLVGFRELSTNIMEVPSGVVADLCGRRRSMILAFVAYIISFAIFGVSSVVWHLFAAMFFFSIGQAFRTGTHKAMILDWLRLEGREDEKTKTYGFTRSWSKIGSALAVLIAAGLVFYTGRYSDIFLFSIPPYLLGIVNFLGYPPVLDGRPASTPSVGNMFRHLWAGLRQALFDNRLRRLLLESMGYEGTFTVLKDYLQPIIKQMALTLPLLAMFGPDRRTAILIACFYFVLALGAGAASRKSYVAAQVFGGESRAAQRLWTVTAGIFVGVATALWYEVFWPAAVGFVILEIVRNFWRPMMISRVDNETDAEMGATMLSVESQAKGVGAMILAPAIGFGVDYFAIAPGQPAVWVVGIAGAAVAVIGSLVRPMTPSAAELRDSAG